MKHAPLFAVLFGFFAFVLWWAYFHEHQNVQRLRSALETVCAAKLLAPAEDRERIKAACSALQ